MSDHFKHKGIHHAGLDRYITEHTSPEPELLRDLFRETWVKVHHPRRTSDHLTGQLLQMVCLMLKPMKVLEIGTFTGYGTIAMASVLPAGAVLDTIEINDEMETGIRSWIGKAGLEDKVRLHIGDAMQIIPTLEGTYDLIFIDGDKDQYVDYYEAVMKKSHPGTILIADNTLWSGKVLENDIPPGDHFTRGLQKFNDHVQADPRVQNFLMPVFDGVTLIYVNRES
jgi:predicted O-methyltransferase YrrM